eukprot:CAMPEP_0182898546 /NCGR_PEP_ID=MMETSP0034_2-20130328/27549_1 /TAXON_ID=156128 /ORGANISM="Nephroselmis pyriformis, Strain CCMP717" /LENGTH=109 /DNA_ID=CAMNT_0025032523 /DNA_START=102 /DNA_END=434 /DNA_ORIENTATION=+
METLVASLRSDMAARQAEEERVARKAARRKAKEEMGFAGGRKKPKAAPPSLWANPELTFNLDEDLDADVAEALEWRKGFKRSKIYKKTRKVGADEWASTLQKAMLEEDD